MKTVFNEIFEKNKWGSKESVSGRGSTLKRTKEIRKFLPEVFFNLKIKSLLDAPCGDFNWMKEINLDNIIYTGGDIVESLVEQCRRKYEKENISFIFLDVANHKLPSLDAILCRDLMIHLPNEKVLQIIKNIKNANIRWGIFTTYPEIKVNKQIKEGSWRKINLQVEPFNFPEPIMLCDEKETAYHSGKFIGVWDITKLND